MENDKAVSGKKLLFLGGGGHCHSVIDSVISSGQYSELGIIDYVDCSFFGVQTIGNDDDLQRLFDEGWTDAFITVGSVGDTGLRHKLYEKIRSIGFNIPSIIDPSSIISSDVILGKGIFVGKRAVINSGASIGDFSIINTGSIIDHDCKIGSFVHISPGAVLCGMDCIGNDTHIGAGTVIRQQITIGEYTLIGAGSVVVNDIESNVKAYGNPCKTVS